jgi:hypothetical protein
VNFFDLNSKIQEKADKVFHGFASKIIDKGLEWIKE